MQAQNSRKRQHLLNRVEHLVDQTLNIGVCSMFSRLALETKTADLGETIFHLSCVFFMKMLLHLVGRDHNCTFCGPSNFLSHIAKNVAKSSK